MSLTDQRLLAKVAIEEQSWEIRRAAVEKLADQALLACIAKTDRVRDVREAAVKKLTDQALLAEILEKHSDSSVRAAAATVLGRGKGAHAVDPLLRAFADGSSDVRGAAAAAAGELGDTRAIRPLLQLLWDACEKSQHIRRHVADALDKLGDHRWKELIRGDDEDFLRLVESGQPLPCDVGPTIIKLLTECQDTSTLSRSATVLGRLKDSRAIDPLIKLLEQRSRDDCLEHELSVAITEALVNIGPLAVGPLITTLERGKTDCQRAKAHALGELGHGQAIRPLFDLLQHPDGTVRKEAADALERLGEPSWKDIVTGDEYDFVRLAQNGVPIPFGVLEHGVRCDSPAAIRALAESGDQRLVPMLVRQLSLKSSVVVNALNRLGWEPTSPEEQRNYYLALSNDDLKRSIETGKVSIQMIREWLAFYSACWYKYAARALQVLAATRNSEVETELLAIMKGGGPYAKDARDLLNRGPATQDRILCPECRAYLGLRQELKISQNRLTEEAKSGSMARGTVILADYACRCPHCGVSVLL